MQRVQRTYYRVTHLQVNHEDKDWFEKTILQTIRSSFGGLPADMAQAERVCKELGERPRYFVDFMRPAEEDPETGEDLPRPRIYEVTSHDAPSRHRHASRRTRRRTTRRTIRGPPLQAATGLMELRYP